MREEEVYIRIVLLGAYDPEMKEIENILREQGIVFVYATKGDKRVHAGNAYEADGYRFPEEMTLVSIKKFEIVISVECSVQGIDPDLKIDHHRPGDTKFGKTPADYWRGSSLGRVCMYLGIPPSKELRIIAAMDHCYRAALQGKCPGVHPEDVKRESISQTAARFDILPSKVEEVVDHFKQTLRSADSVMIGEQYVKTPQDILGVGYSLWYLAAQLAAILEEEAVILLVFDSADSDRRLRVHLCGDSTAGTVEVFKNTWGPKNGLASIYGMGDRGYAGGYKDPIYAIIDPERSLAEISAEIDDIMRTQLCA